MYINLNGCKCSLSVWGKDWKLFSFVTEPECRGQGAAKKLLRIVRKCADRHGATVTLHVAPFPAWRESEPPLSVEAVAYIYQRMGWMPQGPIVRGVVMIYDGRKK